MFLTAEDRGSTVGSRMGRASAIPSKIRRLAALLTQAVMHTCNEPVAAAAKHEMGG